MRLRVISELVNGDKIKIGSYLDPDNFFETAGSKTFIYHKDGTLHYSPHQSIRHIDLIAQHATYYAPDLADTNFKDFDELSELARQQGMVGRKFAPLYTYIINELIPRDRKESDLDALIGRVGNDGLFVAFWNDTTKPHLVISCLRKLINEKLITPETIYVLGRKRVLVSDILGGTRVYISPEDQEKRELMRKLHLMSPQQKKAAMKELGLVGGGHKPGWQKASEKSGLVRPGQKWWASTSESIGG